MSRAIRKARAQIEKCLVQILANRNLILPTNTQQIAEQINSKLNIIIQSELLHYLIQKLSIHKVIDVKDVNITNEFGYEIIQVEREKLLATYSDILDESSLEFSEDYGGSVKVEEDEKTKIPSTEKRAKLDPKDFNDDIMSLLSLPSTKEKQNKQVGEEILELLSKPTAKERSLVEKFKSQGAQGIMEFCPHGTRIECLKALQIALEEEALNAIEEKKEALNSSDASNSSTTIKLEKTKPTMCKRLHFKKIIQAHTDESLGDCSFLNTCFHMDSCKYVHYQVDAFMEHQNVTTSKVKIASTSKTTIIDTSKKLFVPKRPVEHSHSLHPPQWIQCDLRYLDMTIFNVILGKFAVIMMDPPWDIHMELPYGTMSDDEMRQLGVPALQDDGLIFLWVTGRAMELGRECLKLWGYDRVDELIWVKTNQLQRIIRTGRTGHWLNHGKEHCLVGLKGNPPNLNRGLDCDVIVAEVRATSHKPDEIYGMIERLSPGSRKIELFGRPHNVQPNWITLGNQLDGIRLVDPELITSFQKRYPDGLRWENS